MRFFWRAIHMWNVISHIVLYVNGTLWFSDWEWSHNVPIHTLWFQRGSKTEHAISRPDWCSTGKLSLLKSHIHYMWKRKFYMWMILCDFPTKSYRTIFVSNFLCFRDGLSTENILSRPHALPTFTYRNTISHIVFSICEIVFLYVNGTLWFSN